MDPRVLSSVQAMARSLPYWFYREWPACIRPECPTCRYRSRYWMIDFSIGDVRAVSWWIGRN